MPSRIVKVVQLRKRSTEDNRALKASRECWKDYSYMLLNEEGNLFHSKHQWYHVAPDHIHSGIIDIMTFEDEFLSAGINGPDAAGNLSTTIISINPATRAQNMAYQGMTWPKYDIQ